MKERKVELERETAETSVKVKLNLDGRGRASLNTGLSFLDHLLGAFAKHGLFDLEIEAKLKRVNEHHLAEDVAIVLGQALRRALGDKRGIRRFGHAIVPMDDTLVMVAVDLSGRPYTVIEADFRRKKLGDLSTELIRHFLESFASNGGITLHVRSLYSKNEHHKAEAIFKASGVAVSEATRVEERLKAEIPSQKEVLN